MKMLLRHAPSAIGLAVIAAPAALAQPVHRPISIRVEVSEHTIPPVHSYSLGESGDWFVILGGISGQGLHDLAGGADPGVLPPSFPVNVFNTDAIAYNHRTGAVLTAPVSTLPEPVRQALTQTNAASVQIGQTLLIYGGYGPTADGSDWDTRATVTSVDLPAVLAAMQAGGTLPASAFAVRPCPDGRVAGGTIVKFDDSRFALIGGSLFIGDYAGNTPFVNLYAEAAHLFDSALSVTAPTGSMFGATLHRRDMNALPMTYASAQGPPRPGFAIAGGVFQNGFFVWKNPLWYAQGDPAPTDELIFAQQMNQYESGALSFYSEFQNENLQVLLGGISASRHVNGQFIGDFSVPWVTEITQIRVRDGVYLDETVIGQTPLPTSNVHTVLAKRVPRLPNGQILLDEMPPAEVLVARIPAGLRAAEPAGAPVTFASGQVWEVYATVGLPGDINGDGVVNGADLTFILSAWGTDATRPDVTWDGVIGTADLSYVLNRLGSVAPAAARSASAVEPAAGSGVGSR